jgi:hypothetical protein
MKNNNIQEVLELMEANPFATIQSIQTRISNLKRDNINRDCQIDNLTTQRNNALKNIQELESKLKLLQEFVLQNSLGE